MLPAGSMDERSFHTFYSRTARPLRTYIARVLGDATQADDIMQESYLRLLRMSSAPDDERQLRALLFRIASNLIVDHWRRHRRERHASDTQRVDPVTSGPDIPLRLDMTRVFRQLTPQQRQMMWLAYVEGADHREIAAAVGLRERSVRVLLHRARQKLAQLLRDRGPVEQRSG
jgi:RNA polymerase sigma-70 factor (ECF subfamily)